MSSNVVLSGCNLTRDPEMRFTPSGKAVVELGVADNRSWTDGAGTKKEQVSYYRVQAWGSLAENVVASLHKGDRVTITGRLEENRWEKDGEKHSMIKIIAQQVCPALDFAEVTITRNSKRAEGAAAPVGAAASNGSGEDTYREEPW